MIGNINRFYLNTHRLHSVKQFGGVWSTFNLKRNMHLLFNKVLINGEWLAASSNEELPVFNPANGSVIGHVPDLNTEDVQTAIDSAYNAFQSEEWSSLTAKERSGLLKVCIAQCSVNLVIFI